MAKAKKLRHRVTAKSPFVLLNVKEKLLKTVIVSEYAVVPPWMGKTHY